MIPQLLLNRKRQMGESCICRFALWLGFDHRLEGRCSYEAGQFGRGLGKRVNHLEVDIDIERCVKRITGEQFNFGLFIYCQTLATKDGEEMK